MSNATANLNNHFISIKQDVIAVDRGQAKAVEHPVGSSNPEQHVWSGYDNQDAGMRAGVWDSQPGSWRVEIEGYTEFCALTEGSVVVEEDNGARHELKAGDALVMEDGFRGTWTVDNYARKYYFITNTAE